MMKEKEVLNRICMYFDMNQKYPTEQELMKKTKLFLELVPNLWFQRLRDDSESGKPDWLICYKGRFIAIECKDDTGRASALQIQELLKITNCGGIACICQTLQQVKEAIFMEEE